MARFLFLVSRLWVAGLILAGVARGASQVAHEVLAPVEGERRIESDFFVARWSGDSGSKVNEAEVRAGLATLEQIRAFYVGTLGFPAPYAGKKQRFKTDVVLDEGAWVTGGGTGAAHPRLRVHPRAFRDPRALACEFARCLQFSSLGLRDSPYAGWAWDSMAEWMAHQLYPKQTALGHQLVDAPHLYYGSSRTRRGNWLFWEFIKDQHGAEALVNVWTHAPRAGDPLREEADPLLVLAKTRGWDTAALNDAFGRWAMRNAVWDYANGAVYRQGFDYAYRDGAARNRVTILDAVDAASGRYRVPAYRAPQRFGYNLVRLAPERAGAEITVRFRGLAQEEPATKRFPSGMANTPSAPVPPSPGWRWGLVAERPGQAPRYSELQRDEWGSLTWTPAAGETLWLVVTAAPRAHERIRDEQTYFSIYRYPWEARIQGATPLGSGPGPLAPVEGRRGAPHPNGGGWVEETASVEPDAYVAPSALVLDRARVGGTARVEDQAIVSGDAVVSDSARVAGRALVTGRAIVRGRAEILADATVRGGVVSDRARVGALTILAGDRTRVEGDAVVETVANLIANRRIGGGVRLYGDAELTADPGPGTYAGLVDEAAVRDPARGAGRKGPVAEVTAEFLVDPWPKWR